MPTGWGGGKFRILTDCLNNFASWPDSSPDVLEQIQDSVGQELKLTLIAMDVGSPYQDRPHAAKRR